MNIAEHLAKSAAWYPTKTALVYGNRSWTYEELDGLSQAAARELLRLGVKRGDRVGLLLPNQPSFVVWYFATLRLGAIAVSLSTRLKPKEAAFMLEDCQAKVVVVLHEGEVSASEAVAIGCSMERCASRLYFRRHCR